MRLICPSCGAQYEVPEDVIPAEGRDVQCSACSNTWFQAHPDADPALADERHEHSLAPMSSAPSSEQMHPSSQPEPSEPGDPAFAEPEQQADPTPAPEQHPAPEPAPETQVAPDAADDGMQNTAPEAVENAVPQRSLDQSVADVLRQEAEYEASVRAAEAKQAAPLESQPDLGLDSSPEDESARRTREARERMARMRGEPTPTEAAMVGAAAVAAGSRSDLLPDIEEINSTLRASGERRPSEASDTDLKGTAPRMTSKRRRFRQGFYGILLIALIGLALYVFGPRLSAAVPATAPFVDSYTQQVETARQWLADIVAAGLARLDQMASENL